MSEERALPHSDDAERAVLGAIILEPGAMAAVLPILPAPDLFYAPEHREVYVACRQLFKDGGFAEDAPLDPVLVGEMLNERGDVETARRWRDELSLKLSDEVPSVANAAHYARIVRRKASLRGLIERCTEIEARAYAEDTAVLVEAPGAIAEAADAAEPEPQADNAEEVAQLVDRAESGELDKAALATGIGKIDVVTAGGFRRGEMWTIGGRPGSGKSSLLLNLFAKGLNLGRRMAVFSLEVARERFLQNLIAHLACADSQTWRDRTEAEQWRRVKETGQRLTAGNLAETFNDCIIDDGVDLTPATLRAKCRRAAIDGLLDIVFLDYLQLMSGDSAETREREYARVSEASRACKLLAKECNCVVVALSQLNRNSVNESRAPRLSDLKASGSIEQDSDGVLLMHEEPDGLDGDSDRLDVIVAKQRHGPRRPLRFCFRRHCLTFEPV